MDALDENSFNSNPFIQFREWYNSRELTGIPGNDIVYLGTSSSDGRVSVRTVLLKDYDERGFVFFTNYNSRKSSDIASNPHASLLFYWPGQNRQIRTEGIITKVSESESDSYFATRPRESQTGAWSSEQSSVIASRDHLEHRYLYFKRLFEGKEVERPPHWGGFRLLPDWFEFWQDGAHRLHDRIIYRQNQGSWILERLAP